MFHLEDGLFFDRTDDGSIRILKRESGRPDAPIVFDHTTDADGWASVVSSVSKGGEIDNRYYAAKAFHATALASCATRIRNPRAPCAGAGDATAQAGWGRWNGPPTSDMTTTRWMKYEDLPWAHADSGTCRVCGCERKEGERWQTWCKKDGEACLHWYKIRADPQYARRAVERRDKGVCALCGLDTRALAQQICARDRSATASRLTRSEA